MVVLLLAVVTDYSVFLLSAMRAPVLRRGEAARRGAGGRPPRSCRSSSPQGLLVAAGLATLRLAGIGVRPRPRPGDGRRRARQPGRVGALRAGRRWACSAGRMFWPGLSGRTAEPLLTRAGDRGVAAWPPGRAGGSAPFRRSRSRRSRSSSPRPAWLGYARTDADPRPRAATPRPPQADREAALGFAAGHRRAHRAGGPGARHRLPAAGPERLRPEPVRASREVGGRDRRGAAGRSEAGAGGLPRRADGSAVRYFVALRPPSVQLGGDRRPAPARGGDAASAGGCRASRGAGELCRRHGDGGRDDRA